MGRLSKRQRHLVVARANRQAVQGLVVNPADPDTEHVPSEDSDVISIPEEFMDGDRVDQAFDRTLRWTDNARPKRIAANLGTSRGTEFRRKRRKHRDLNP